MTTTVPTVASGWARRRELRLTEYERVALELFAARGFREVTVDAIAAAAGVSARTLFRYFPTKEDFLRGLPRRVTAALVELIEDLEPSATPLATAWRALGEVFAAEPPDAGLVALWRSAAADAPEVHAQVRGERTQALVEALAAYCAASFGTDPATDVRAGLVAGVLVGVELVLVEMYGMSETGFPEMLAAADRLVAGIDPTLERIPR